MFSPALDLSKFYKIAMKLLKILSGFPKMYQQFLQNFYRLIPVFPPINFDIFQQFPWNFHNIVSLNLLLKFTRNLFKNKNVKIFLWNISKIL